MADFDKSQLTGIKDFCECSVMVKQFFPIGVDGKLNATCEKCRFYRFSSKKCGLTDEVCFAPSRYVGNDCPFYDDLANFYLSQNITK